MTYGQVRTFAGENRYDEALQVKKATGRTSVMFWGGISMYGPVGLVRLQGYQNLDTYKKTLEDTIPAFRLSFVETHGSDIIFQQDNASCHVSAQLGRFFDRKEIVRHRHPPKSPDLSPIENVWD
ncbi:hypothetical protein BV898_03537 [Hypsibius exemplaris]|uniref:Tc1-like transposase DDE domain-containing protein n=1 Tax=Hypsibius exemplaris TaxID=2072580 RepID=A0A1W0X5N1_HYPEX|nr:hypothetical protein BV898_03537 [Hypsibius exemplaris]